MSEDEPEARAPHSPEGLLGWLGITSPRRIVLFTVCLAAALGVLLLPGPRTLDPPARRALFLLVLAAALWTTEAIPAYAVGILVIALQVFLFGTERGGAESPDDWERYLTVIGHPLVWLFFGGFVLAAGMARTGLDRRLAHGVLGRLGGRPPVVLAGVMGITFALSLVMSNTATAAMMLAMLAPVVASLERDDPFGKGLLLGVAVAANLGGMGSLIGTPPNAIAVGALAGQPGGPQIDFLGWLGLGLPLALVLGLLAWAVLVRRYPARAERVASPGASMDAAQGEEEAAPLWKTLVVGGTLALTVGLWTSAQWHPIPTAAVSLIPIVLLTTTGVLDVNRIRGLPYDVLFLLAGGLALGQVVQRTGLSDWIVARLPLEGLGILALGFALAYATVVLSNLMSNTAAANLLVPLSLGMASGQEARLAIPIALAASAAMALPIATPPNALAAATGRLGARDFLFMGLLMGVVAPAAGVLWCSLWL